MGITGPQVVEFNIEAVRKRPGMYVGDTARYGLYHLGYFVLDLMLSASRRPPSSFEVRIEPGGSLQISCDCEPNDPESVIALLDAGSYRGPPEALETNRWWELLTVSALSEQVPFRWAGALGGGSWTGRRGKRSESSRQEPSKQSLTEVRFKVDGDSFQCTSSASITSQGGCASSRRSFRGFERAPWIPRRRARPWRASPTAS